MIVLKDSYINGIVAFIENMDLLSKTLDQITNCKAQSIQPSPQIDYKNREDGKFIKTVEY
jgi:hypothetical protein